MRLNNEAYTSEPCEPEYLLREGFKVLVLEVQRDVKVDNGDDKFQDLKGKSITVIHLFHNY